MRQRTVMLAAAGCLLAALAFWFWPTPKPHLLLITLDTTRADRLGCYGYAAARTPVLDSLAQAGVLCERACTVAPLTLPAHASLFTGLYPVENGVRTNGRGRLDDRIATLADVLRRSGYDTAAYVAAFVLDGKFGLDKGFRTYDDDFSGDEPAEDLLHRQRNGEAVVDAALAWLEKSRSRPFFCWVHLYDPHDPYRAHDDVFDSEFEDRPYDGEIAYVDRQVGRLMDYLKIHGLESQTLVVVVGDHGEGLAEHVERTHGMTLYNATMRVPLIFRHSGRMPAGRHVAGDVSIVDLSPTILDLMGLPDKRAISGKSFKPALLGSPVVPSPCYGATDEPFLVNGCAPLRCLTEWPWKYIRTTRVELYDLANDPHERENVAEARSDKTREMESRLVEFESRLTPRAETAVQLTPAERRTLASLGYAGGTGHLPANPARAELPDIKDVLPVDSAVEETERLIHQGDVDPAIDRLHEIRRSAPGHTKACWVLACALRDKLRFEEAADVFRALLAVKPDSREGHFGLGLVHRDTAQTDAAILEFRKTLEIDPDFVEAHFNLAAIDMAAGQIDEALSHLDSVLAVDRRHYAAYQLRAFLMSRLGRTREAISDFRMAVRCEPDSAEAHHNLGLALANHGEAEEARRYLSRAVELNPRNADSHLVLGTLLMSQGQYEEAIGHLSKALELEPGNVEAEERLQAARQALRRRKPAPD
jgi:arylsulfatase A-like enzyme/tetratricopeptide (TPR) repeat protein